MGKRGPGGKQLVIWTHKADMFQFRAWENVSSTALVGMSQQTLGFVLKAEGAEARLWPPLPSF